MKGIILFGSGVYGLKMLQYFGSENVEAFCDNECIVESKKYGISYIPFDKLKSIGKECVIILSVNPRNAEEISEQLERNGIDDFLICDEELQNDMKQYNAEKYLGMLQDDAFRMELERNQYRRRFQNKKEEYNIIKSLSDIRHLKKSAGYISYIQKRLAVFTKELFQYFVNNNLNIKPFIAAGTAIGKYRHNGFIPWDDDIDFGLFRDDYMHLIDYGRRNFIYLECYASFNEDDNREIEYALINNPQKYIMTVSLSCIRIFKGTSRVDCDVIDFFPYDFYDDSYNYEEHIELIKACEKYRYTQKGRKVIKDIISNSTNIVSDSNHIYFGLDGMDSYVCPHRGWIKREDILPLRKIEFEDIPCYAPSHIEEYLYHCFNEFNNFPDNILGLHMTQVSAEILKSDYLYCGLHVKKTEDVDNMLNVYDFLRKRGVYCVFYYNREDYKNTELIESLMEYCVEYIDGVDQKFDYIISNYSEKENKIKVVPLGGFNDVFLNEAKSNENISLIKRNLIICEEQ